MSADIDVRQAIQAGVEAISSAEAIVVCAGAGMSVDSGLPDFRSNEGLWRAYPPLAKDNTSFHDLARPNRFRDEPELAWAFYGHRQQLYATTEPHAGFSELLRWCQGMEHGFFVFTSNVDGHFQKARFPAQRIAEIHGNIQLHQCMTPCGDNIWMDERIIEVDAASLEVRGRLPHCPYCDGLARPNVLMFGDGTWLSEISDRQHARYLRWLRGAVRKRLVVIEIGAGSGVPTVRHESESLVANHNAQLIRINPNESSAPTASISIPLTAADAIAALSEALPRIVKRRFERHAKQARFRRHGPSMPEVIDSFAKTDPGAVLSTAPLSLRAIKARKTYAKGFQVTLPSGAKAWVEDLAMTHTHSGLLEGLPRGGGFAPTRKAKAWARDRLIGPEPIVLPPKCFDATSESPIVPPLQFAAHISSFELLEPTACGSCLNLVWFAEVDDEKSVVDFVAEALAQVDWARQASSFDI